MRLWTLHTEGFNIESEIVDFRKSAYYKKIEDFPNIQKAYKRLFSELAEERFLWCFMRRILI